LTVFLSSLHCGHNFMPRISFSTLNFRVQNSHSYQIQPIPAPFICRLNLFSLLVSALFVNNDSL
jgi:hypothetical protein